MENELFFIMRGALNPEVRGPLSGMISPIGDDIGILQKNKKLLKRA
jgi:hypothetical protein